MGNCPGWLHLDRFDKIINLISHDILSFVSFYSISRFKLLVDFLQDACTYSTYSPRAPPAPQKATKAHEDEHRLCSPGAILFPIPHPSSNSGSALILIEGNCSC